MTAFWVGNKISLGDTPPKSVAVDLLVAFSFNANPLVMSAAFPFKLILLDKLSVSLAIRLLNIVDVSAIFNLVSKDESE